MTEFGDTSPGTEIPSLESIEGLLDVQEKLGHAAFVYNTSTGELYVNVLATEIVSPELLLTYIPADMANGSSFTFLAYNSFYKYTARVVQLHDGIFIGEVVLDNREDALYGQLLHALRGYLSPVLGSGEVLAGHLSILETDRVLTFVGYIQRGADSLLKIANMLTDTIQRFQAINIQRLSISEITKLVYLEYDKVELEVAEELYVFGDVDIIQLVLSSIVDNAFRHAGENVHVQITARGTSGGKYVEISVSDNGYGIEEQYLRMIFLPFNKIAETSNKYGASLFRARILMGAMGGKIWAESEVGQGTVFHLLLPLAAESQS